jgi:hypothetical protein
MQTNKCDIPHEQNEEQKSYNLSQYMLKMHLTKFGFLSWLKTHNKLAIEGMYRNTIKSKNDKFTVIISKSEKLKPFPLKSGTRQGYPLSSLLFNST